jgi:hypothetical protein
MADLPAPDDKTHAPSDRINELQRRIAELKNSWPAHSLPASLLQQLEDLEDELEIELNQEHPSKFDPPAEN